MTTADAKKMPPGCYLLFPDSAESLTRQADELIARSKAFYDRQGAVDLADVDVASFARPMAVFDGEYSILRSNLDFVQYVFADKAMRDASTDADKKISEHEVDIAMRRDLHDRLVAVQGRLRSGGDTASAEMSRYVDRSVLDGLRNGLGLDDEAKRARIKAIKTEMNNIAIDFERNLSEDVSFLLFDRAELAGLTDDFVNSLEVDAESGKLKVTLKYPHYFPAMKLAQVPETRRRLEFAFNTRCKDANLVLLQRLLALRCEKSNILGYPTHADFALELRMAKNAATVDTFLSDLAAKLKPLQARERSRLLEVKQADCQRLGVPFDGAINAWDMRYLMDCVERQDYSVDHETLRQYFPVERVTQGLLDIYQRILGLRFQHLPDCWVWHQDVTAYSVEDAATGEHMAYFFLDLYPRDGKYGHAACFPLQPSCLTESGNRQPSVCAVVANFTKPTADKPSLLTHEEVETFFHEFGHAMHNVCARTDTARFAGTHVERDFVEAPSQMLENWVWSSESLGLMSGHYATGQPIPADLLKSLVASRQANAAFINLRQITLSSFDQAIHTSRDPAIDVCSEYVRKATDILGVAPSEGSAFPANFGHLAGGYDAQYYGYMWSEVYSADMFQTVFGESGVLNAEAGMAYRRCILRPGGSRDGFDMLRDFLGRDPTPNAFLKMKGL